MRKRAVDKLALEIAELDRQRRERMSHVDEEKLTEAERAFCVLADSKGKRVFRHGWPDFLVYDPDAPTAMCVEVKTHSDAIQPSQRTMFSVLDAIGLRVMIWSPEEPNTLVPWRTWEQRQRERRRPHGSRGWGPRQPVLGRSGSADRTKGKR